MYKVIVNGKTLYAKDGALLSQVLAESGNAVEHPCGGRGVCKKCTVAVNGKTQLSCRYAIESDIVVSLPDRGEIVSETGVNATGEMTENLCFALDIGTTTLALALVSLDKKEIIKVATRTNPQRTYGADVITRIDYCRKNGVESLHRILTEEISQMISEFNLPTIDKLYVSGNTTMLHLFFGTDCSSMGVAPYKPVFLAGKTENAGKLGIEGVETVYSLPSIDAFVGADITAGLNYIGLPSKGKYNLLVDLGTNAEIVLFSENSVVCTSAAAGPCFEGAAISCGMSATNGAIYAYSLSEIKTIGKAPAKGICGTGLIDIIAAHISDETIDKTGYMEAEKIEIADGVTLNQSDVRQYQLAKSAVYSAILTLMRISNVSSDDIEKMYISGGFSAKINVTNAVITGLLPKELAKKCVAVNNSSLLGTVKYAAEKNDITVLTENAKYVDLSSDAVFSDLFIENMMF